MEEFHMLPEIAERTVHLPEVHKPSMLVGLCNVDTSKTITCHGIDVEPGTTRPFIWNGDEWRCLSRKLGPMASRITTRRTAR